MLEFIEFPVFTTRLRALAKDRADDVLLEIQNDLLRDPERGDVIKGTSGVRKDRAADPSRGKGKRGGYRYMYYYIKKDSEIYLLMVFNKDEQDDLSTEQKKTLKAAIKGLQEAK